ncbi:MAG: hypothetical protein M3R15_30295 [Acidobacteriota bacterium]|nr:hypothetical protein [Acidobacteriota bacterium]
MMTVLLAVGAFSSFILDWSSNHLLSPAWHPHARFHGALLLFFLSGVSATGIWLLWHESKEPEVAIKVAVLISVSFWAPLFFIPFLLPSSTWWAGAPGAEPRIAGYIVYPNLLVAGVFLFLTALCYRVIIRQNHSQDYSSQTQPSI